MMSMDDSEKRAKTLFAQAQEQLVNALNKPAKFEVSVKAAIGLLQNALNQVLEEEIG